MGIMGIMGAIGTIGAIGAIGLLGPINPKKSITINYLRPDWIISSEILAM